MPSLASVAVAVAAFVVMEPVTALTHRFVMHGVGFVLHRSHHRAAARSEIARRWEANDWFPVAFAAVVMIGFAVGFNTPGAGMLVPIGVGVTVYGAVYALVHDVYIHGRLGWLRGRRLAVLDRLAAAHAVHHRRGGAPYGMLLPIVPAERQSVVRPSAPRPGASGSTPSQVPLDA